MTDDDARHSTRNTTKRGFVTQPGNLFSNTADYTTMPRTRRRRIGNDAGAAIETTENNHIPNEHRNNGKEEALASEAVGEMVETVSSAVLNTYHNPVPNEHRNNGKEEALASEVVGERIETVSSAVLNTYHNPYTSTYDRIYGNTPFNVVLGYSHRIYGVFPFNVVLGVQGKMTVILRRNNKEYSTPFGSLTKSLIKRIMVYLDVLECDLLLRQEMQKDDLDLRVRYNHILNEQGGRYWNEKMARVKEQIEQHWKLKTG